MKPEQPQAPGFKAKKFAETYGPEVMQGYLDGLNAGNSVAEKVVESIYKEMGTKSPSEVVPKLHSEEPTVSNLETDEKEVWTPMEQRMKVDLSSVSLVQLMAIGAKAMICDYPDCNKCSLCGESPDCLTYAIVHPEDTLKLLGVDIDSYTTQAEQDVLKAQNAELLEKQQRLMRDIAAMEADMAKRATKPVAMGRAECLDRAKACVCGQREQDYGSPEDSFDTIAKLWSAYLGEVLEDVLSLRAVDVAAMMALLKIARIGGERATADSFIDLAGYAACGCEIATKGDAACSS